jgi:prepilin-type N-terminal cleavage/methylation domain-containing protein
MFNKANAERGDTLVEVLMSIAILGLVIVGAITIMNRGLASTQTALEHSQVRLLVNSQYEILKRLRDSYATDPSSDLGKLWHQIVATSNSSLPTYADDCTVSDSKQGTAFYLQQQSSTISMASYTSSSLPSAVPTPGDGFWVEPSKSTTFSPPYMDFVIRACWRSTGNIDQRTVTAVRLYDPDTSH